jgi:hypothetical protein
MTWTTCRITDRTIEPGFPMDHVPCEGNLPCAQAKERRRPALQGEKSMD